VCLVLFQGLLQCQSEQLAEFQGFICDHHLLLIELSIDSRCVIYSSCEMDFVMTVCQSLMISTKAACTFCFDLTLLRLFWGLQALLERLA
jgi:hypothetical protein